MSNSPSHWAFSSLGISMKSLLLIYLGYGFLLGTGTGVIYISPVKTMMLWFPKNKAIAAAIPIISFGLGSTLSTILFHGFWGIRGFITYGVTNVFSVFALFYLVPMVIAAFLLKKPVLEQQAAAVANGQSDFRYTTLLKYSYFIQSSLRHSSPSPAS